MARQILKCYKAFLMARQILQSFLRIGQASPHNIQAFSNQIVRITIVNRIIHGLQNNRTHHLCHCPGLFMLLSRFYIGTYLITCLLYFCVNNQ